MAATRNAKVVIDRNINIPGKLNLFLMIGAGLIGSMITEARKNWRIKVGGNNGGDTTTIPGVELREKKGGPKIDQTATVTTSSSLDASHTGDATLDGNSDTYWETTSGDTDIWVEYTFEEPVTIEEVVIQSFGTTSGTSENLAKMPKSFSIEGSVDGTTWEPVTSYDDQTGWVADEERTFTDLAVEALAPTLLVLTYNY